MMDNIVSILQKRQYHFSANRRNLNSCPILRPNYLPPSYFDSLTIELCYNFIDSHEFNDSPITVITHRENNSKELLLANDVGDIVILDKCSLKELKKFHAHNCAIFDVKYRPQHANHILTAAGDRSIILWDINHTDQSLASFFPAHQGSVKSLSFYCPNTFISGGRDGAIKIWDLRTSCVLKHGPVLSIPDPHIHILPSIKSPNSRIVKSRRQNPIAWSSQNINYHPSNVVTCVDCHPTNNNYFYSSGIADNSIKVWDIRQCRRQYQCTLVPTPIKIHSTKNISSASSNHGYSSFIIKHHPLNGSLLYGSSTNGSIYVFNDNSQFPVMALSGRFSNSQTKISAFGDDYLLSGSTDSKFYLWNCNLSESCDSNNENLISIENRLPLFEMTFDQQQELPLIFGDFNEKNIYCASEPQILWKWSFGKNLCEKSEQFEDINSSIRPIFQRFKPPENYDKTININLKRASSFEAITHRRSSSLTRPLSVITNWIQSEPKRFKSSSNNNIKSNDKNNNSLNDNDDDYDQENIRKKSKSTTQKSAKKKSLHSKQDNHNSLRKKYLKRNLFNDNRKISEFFTKSNHE